MSKGPYQLKPFTLAEQQREHHVNKLFPKNLTVRGRKGQRLEVYEDRLNRLEAEIKQAREDVLTENLLNVVISEEHLKSLKSKFSSREQDDKLILDWLCLRFRGANSEKWFSEETKYKDFLEMPKEKIAPPTKNTSISDERDKDEEAILEFFEEEETFTVRDFIDFKEQSSDDESEGYDFPSFTSYELDDCWEQRGGLIARQNYVKSELFQQCLASKQEEDNISNLWDLPLAKRWNLYRSWILRFINGRNKEIRELQELYQKDLESLHELRHARDLFILSKARIIGMTTTGAAKNRKLLEDLQPAIVIVEEAAEVLEAHIVTCLKKNTEQLILIGDHKQLRPIPSIYMLAAMYHLDVSLFERLVKNDFPLEQLSIQHRMHPVISNQLVPHIYKELKNHISTESKPMVMGVKKRMFFINHDFFEGQDRENTSKVNTHEAQFLVKLCEYLIKQGYEQKQITILATYSAQLGLIRKLMTVEGKCLLFRDVKATTVDNYQGEENDILLISFVRSNANQGIGFLKTENRVCVALSRARNGMYCIGNFRYMAEKCELWKNIVSELDRIEAIGADLELYCQNHPSTKKDVRNIVDFDSVPEGGCNLMCEAKLPCGHRCPKMCHPYDKNHTKYQCDISCTKILRCKKKHRCMRKCFECRNGCEPCSTKVVKELDCGHDIKVECSKDVRDVKCFYPCSEKLPCGHVNIENCGNRNTVCCKELGNFHSPCGHGVKVQCFRSSDEKHLLSSCTVGCDEILTCGHYCSGHCSLCVQGRLHKKCLAICGKTLPCGHICSDPCSDLCPPCEKPCENSCEHQKCEKKCGEKCDPCRKQCTWKCPHQRCTKLCGEPCDRVICKEPCPRKLSCEHPCLGFCGEVCPKLCSTCNEKKFKYMTAGNKSDESNEKKIENMTAGNKSDKAYFIQFKNCKHFFMWSEKFYDDLKKLKVPRCPTCKKALNDKFISSFCNREIISEENDFDLQENEERHNLLRKFARKLGHRIDKDIKPILDVLQKHLNLNVIKTSKLECLEKWLHMVDDLNTCYQKLETLSHQTETKEEFSVHVKVDQLFKLILDFFRKNCEAPSKQQTKDVDFEVIRYTLLVNLLEAGSLARKQKIRNQGDRRIIDLCLCLLQPKPLKPNSREMVSKMISSLGLSA